MAKGRCKQCDGPMLRYDGCSGSNMCSNCYRENVAEIQRKILAEDRRDFNDFDAQDAREAQERDEDEFGYGRGW
jgi:hypothetical protein